MKKFLFTTFLFFRVFFLFAQSSDIDQEIRKLEQEEVRAVLMKDTVVLKKLWHKTFVVNNPENKVIVANANPLDRPVLRAVRTTFTREVEQVTVNGNNVFSMGSETVQDAGGEQNSGELVKRRYTHVWMKIEGEWKLAARHANVICGQK